MEDLTDTHWSAVAERLGRSAGDVFDAKDAALLIPNHYAWSGEIATRLGGTMRPSKVWEAVADVWVRDVIGEAGAKELSEPVDGALRTTE